MTKQTDSAHMPSCQFQQRSRSLHFAQLLLVKSISCIGAFSLLSSNLVLAQTESSIDLIVPTTTTSTPAAPVKSAPATPQTAPAPARQSLRPQISSYPAPAKVQRLRQKLSPAPVPVRRDRPRLNVATPPQSIPTRSVQPSAIPSKNPVRSTQRETAANTKNNNGAYIDPTEYRIGATRSYEAPNAVVLSERSTGCKAILRQGQGLSGGVCGAAKKRSQVAIARNRSINPVRVPGSPAPQWVRRSRAVAIGGGIAPIRVSPIRGSASGSPATRTIQGAIASNAPRSVFYYNRTPRPAGRLGNANIRLLFPLTIPAPITSLFGWRIHPLTGNRRFHSGTDFGASLGTPVLAAHAGNVAIADFLGGYGLTVVLEDEEFTQQTLYGHLSEIFVQSGEWVEQGTVIGRVGSTGNSTGPHLHFETRALTPEGWVATDPSVQLEDALAHLVESLRIASSKKPGA